MYRNKLIVILNNCYFKDILEKNNKKNIALNFVGVHHYLW